MGLPCPRFVSFFIPQHTAQAPASGQPSSPPRAVGACPRPSFGALGATRCSDCLVSSLSCELLEVRAMSYSFRSPEPDEVPHSRPQSCFLKGVQPCTKAFAVAPSVTGLALVSKKLPNSILVQENSQPFSLLFVFNRHLWRR